MERRGEVSLLPFPVPHVSPFPGRCLAVIILPTGIAAAHTLPAMFPPQREAAWNASPAACLPAETEGPCSFCLKRCWSGEILSAGSEGSTSKGAGLVKSSRSECWEGGNCSGTGQGGGAADRGGGGGYESPTKGCCCEPNPQIPGENPPDLACEGLEVPPWQPWPPCPARSRLCLPRPG